MRSKFRKEHALDARRWGVLSRKVLAVKENSSPCGKTCPVPFGIFEGGRDGLSARTEIGCCDPGTLEPQSLGDFIVPINVRMGSRLFRKKAVHHADGFVSFNIPLCAHIETAPFFKKLNYFFRVNLIQGAIDHKVSLGSTGSQKKRKSRGPIRLSHRGRVTRHGVGLKTINGFFLIPLGNVLEARLE
jgi:hypothetical protein